jgi:CHRD domain
MTRVRLALGIALLGVVMTVSAAALAGGGGKTKAKLSGFQEVPAVLTDGNGKLKLRISNTEDKIDFELRYADLEGGNVLFAHIHIGQRGANGAVAAFLCGGGGKPACPPPSLPRASTTARSRPARRLTRRSGGSRRSIPRSAPSSS